MEVETKSFSPRPIYNFQLSGNYQNFSLESSVPSPLYNELEAAAF